MVIKVTEKHITYGSRSDCHRCPIALAMIEAGIYAVSVDEDIMAFRHTPQSELVAIDVPSKILNFIMDFDQGLPVESFEFEIPDQKEIFS